MKMMKYLFLGLLIIANVSCSSDDDGDNFDVVGKWTITEGYIEPGSMDLDLGGMPMTIEYEGAFVNLDEDNYLNFKQDNTFTSYTGDIALEMTLIVMGQPTTDYFEMNEVFGEGTWELSGRELHITNDNGTTIKYHVDSMSGDILELSGNVKDMSPGGESNPILDDMDMTVKMKLRRI